MAPRREFVLFTLEFHKEDGLWVGVCRELGTATDGRSLPKVKEELVELVTLHLNALEDADERGRFFREHGIRLYSDNVPTSVTVSVPVSVAGGSFVEVTALPVTERELVPA